MLHNILKYELYVPQCFLFMKSNEVLLKLNSCGGISTKTGALVLLDFILLLILSTLFFTKVRLVSFLYPIYIALFTGLYLYLNLGDDIQSHYIYLRFILLSAYYYIGFYLMCMHLISNAKPPVDR